MKTFYAFSEEARRVTVGVLLFNADGSRRLFEGVQEFHFHPSPSMVKTAYVDLSHKLAEMLFADGHITSEQVAGMVSRVQGLGVDEERD